MWQLHNASVPSDQDDPSAWATQAQAWAAAMSPHQHDVRDAPRAPFPHGPHPHRTLAADQLPVQNTTHDVGFMVFDSFGVGLQLDGRNQTCRPQVATVGCPAL